ncbi:MAG: chorismate synthase, partial [Candidatus Treponema excrementipullorum]|nr:chorismate synthase [Candidatus Treponema excrementipullorum]
MAGNSFGALFKITTFGESHGAALGVVIDGCPAGVPILRDNIQAALNRRRPGIQDGVLNVAVTARSEPDTVEILSGVFEDKSTGTPIALVIRNTSQNSKDYGNLQYVFRPGHGDFTYQQKYGVRDYRGGGRASGRETAARVAAGAVAQSVLKHFLGNDISVVAYTKRAAGISGNSVDFSVIEKNSLRAADLEAAALMEHEVQRLRQDGDSAGGVVECCVSGVPAGLGEPVFD